MQYERGEGLLGEVKRACVKHQLCVYEIKADYA